MAKNPHAQALGRLGGNARAKSLSREERSRLAGIAAKARFAKMTKQERKQYIRMLVEARRAKRKATEVEK